MYYYPMALVTIDQKTERFKKLLKNLKIQPITLAFSEQIKEYSLRLDNSNFNCFLCFDKLNDVEFTTLPCACELKCHKKCRDEYTKRMYKCVNCLDYVDYNPCKLLLLFGWFYNEVTLFRQIKEKYTEKPFGFGQEMTIFIPRYCDLSMMSENRKQEVDYLIGEINKYISDKRKSLITIIKQCLIELLNPEDLIILTLSYL